MSCGEPHETDCSEVLDHLYEYLDREMPDSDCAKFKEHFDECSPCLEKYGLEQEVKKLVKRCCGHDDVPVGPAVQGDGPDRADPVRREAGPARSARRGTWPPDAGAAGASGTQRSGRTGARSTPDGPGGAARSAARRAIRLDSWPVRELGPERYRLSGSCHSKV